MKDDLARAAVVQGDDEEVRAILQEVCDLTEMGFAALARVTEERWIACQVVDRIAFGLTPGGELEVQKTICNEIRQHPEAVVFDDAVDDPKWETHPVPIFYGFRSYASFPVILADGTFYGTLCAIDPARRNVSSEAVITALRAAADRIAALLSAKLGLEPLPLEGDEGEPEASRRSEVVEESARQEDLPVTPPSSRTTVFKPRDGSRKSGGGSRAEPSS